MHKIFTPFFRGFANFKLIFLRHFSIHFEHFDAHLAALMLNILRHTNFSNF